MVSRFILGITLVGLCLFGLNAMRPTLPNYVVPALYAIAILCVCILSLVFNNQAKIGELAKSIGLLTENEIQLILGIQKKTSHKFGRIALEQQLLSERELAILLEIQAS